MPAKAILGYKKRMLGNTIIFNIMGWALFALTMAITWVAISFLLSVVLLIVSWVFIIGGMTYFRYYMDSRKYLRLLNALGPDVIDARIVKGALECTTSNHGDFYTDYIVQGKYGTMNHYRLWITTSKQFPVPDYDGQKGAWDVNFVEDGNTVTKIAIPVKRGENIILILPEPIPIEIFRTYKSLYEIKLLTDGGENKIMAKFNDLLLHDEDQDMISSLDLLHKIEEIL